VKTTNDMKVRLIPVDRVRVINPRVRDKVKFERVVESIAKLGLKKPITVTVGKVGDDGGETFDLVCGQGRLEAFKALGQAEIPALVSKFSKTDSLLASLIENIARRRVRALDQIQMIEWMRGQGHGYADVAARTGLGEEYVKDILNMLKNGEERLLEAVLHGKIPVSIAVRISGITDDESQQLLVEAYERKEMNQKTLSAFKRVLDQRRYIGRKYGPRQPRTNRRTTTDSLVRAYRNESQRQQLMVRKAKLCEVRLLSTAAAVKVLVTDEDYINLLRAEKLDSMPKFLAERAKNPT
jgi:ParB family chromosome partitioning protein